MVTKRKFIKKSLIGAIGAFFLPVFLTKTEDQKSNPNSAKTSGAYKANRAFGHSLGYLEFK